MATLEIGDETLTVKLGPFEHFFGFSRDVSVPLSSIVRVSVPESKWMALRGWRASGTAFPGKIAIGRRRHGTGWDFSAVNSDDKAVVIELNDGRYEQLVVSVPDAPEAARQIAAAAGIAAG